MANFGWSLEMTVLGMGMVFIMLILLMLLLVAIGQLDSRAIKRQQRAEVEAKNELERPQVSAQSNITKDELSAIAVAIIAHQKAKSKKSSATPRYQGAHSLPQESPWLTVGRYSQMRRTRR